MNDKSEKKTIEMESGMQIAFDETPGSENLILQDKMGSLIKMDSSGNIIIEPKGNLIIKSGTYIAFDGINSGYEAARKGDLIKSTSAEDQKYWIWLSGLIAVFNAWVPVPNDGGASLKAALTAYLGTNPVPKELTGKIIEGSSSVKIGD